MASVRIVRFVVMLRHKVVIIVPRESAIGAPTAMAKRSATLARRSMRTMIGRTKTESQGQRHDDDVKKRLYGSRVDWSGPRGSLPLKTSRKFCSAGKAPITVRERVLVVVQSSRVTHSVWCVIFHQRFQRQESICSCIRT